MKCKYLKVLNNFSFAIEYIKFKHSSLKSSNCIQIYISVNFVLNYSTYTVIFVFIKRTKLKNKKKEIFKRVLLHVKAISH